MSKEEMCNVLYMYSVSGVINQLLGTALGCIESWLLTIIITSLFNMKIICHDKDEFLMLSP